MLSQAHSPARRLRPDAGESSIQPVAVILLIAIAALAGLSLYTLLQLKNFRTEVGERLDSHDVRLALLDGNVARTSSELVSQVGEVKARVASTEKQIDARAKQVETRVLSRTNNLQREIAATRETSDAKINQVGGQLAEYRKETTTQVGELDSRVDTVKEAVDANRAELEKTIADLTSVKGDLGVQSGLIATNGEELEALKKLGERNYHEFNIGKTKKPQRVGPISVKLTGTDKRRNRYSIELWADDKRIVKRRKTLLEPVQFYVEGARVPFELVVNNIENGVIAGYLATPRTAPRGS